MKVVYIIGPFRAPTKWRVCQNVRLAEQLGMCVAELGAMPLIPHKNTENFDGLLTDEFWLDGTRELALRCDAAITMNALGVSCEGSSGSQGEIAAMRKARKPVFVTLGDLKSWLKFDSERRS